MSEAAVVTTTTVILPSAIWLSELSSELERLGIKPDQAPRSARHLLHRVVGHAGYRTNFLIADDEDESIYRRSNYDDR